MTKEQFIDKEITDLKKLMYGDDPEMMSPKEETILRKFLIKFIDDMRKIANGNK